ncbi:MULTISPECIES: hypothetical protein [Sphingomonadaceae]|uniref:Uncharacterized protein n=1 Tax=Sphingomonas sanxanigenens DSM 19645 = NX02 TaxID=1123269 RepID=W0A950_9SPHN|nr:MULTISPECIES: hypothetical protein [Sphingomonadaceae]AHE53601.1 hypothetical protein NX02_09400 [Sphingomonas sanxanigenens DSM 19645 = NX02]OAN53392.1 hypothetical protein A7Q26_05020 [Sphingobium sp. TCM1]
MMGEPDFAELFTAKLITVQREGYGFSALKEDAVAALTFAVVALPLSMAIAIASDDAGSGPRRVKGVGVPDAQQSAMALDIRQPRKGRWFVTESLHIGRNACPRRLLSNFVEVMCMSASHTGSGQQHPIGSKAAISICRLESIVGPRRVPCSSGRAISTWTTRTD